MTLKISRNICTICTKKFSCKQSLHRHKKEYHTENHVIEECEQCSKKFSKKSYLQRHVKVAHITDQENGICDQCDKRFLNEHQLKIHVRNTHKPKEFVCQHCQYEFKIQSSLREHIN